MQQMLANSHTGCHIGQLCIHAPIQDQGKITIDASVHDVHYINIIIMHGSTPVDISIEFLHRFVINNSNELVR